jgi:hypothetical protein
MIVHEGSGIICEERVKDKKIPPSLLRVQKTAKLPELFLDFFIYLYVGIVCEGYVIG